jgi:hypothetical protein
MGREGVEALMSYARFGPDSDVYIYFSVGDYLTCCGCAFTQKGEDGKWRDPRCFSTQEMVDHLLDHEAADHVVPPGLVAELWEDDAENFPEHQ